MRTMRFNVLMSFNVQCDGWYTNSKRCDCGIKWCWFEGKGVVYTNLEHFNIFRRRNKIF